MSRLTDLISKAKAIDPQLGTDMEREFRALSSRLSFGLNFERHKPEAVELPKRSVRRGDKVRVLPPRGSTTKGDQRLWQVKAIRKDKKEADLELTTSEEAEAQTVALDDLVVVAEFGDTIYPGLISTGKVSRSKDKPWHTVINGENYHVLKALTWTHRGKVDAIYIDPPYNTGAKDWKYNNDYVEGEDLYRHSKWLAMMERRLLVAKELLNPADSVLIVTIDEKEYLRLGLLLEQVFPDATIQMVSTQVNPKGVSRGGSFRRSDEYLFFLMFGAARPARMPLSIEWSTSTKNNDEESEDIEDAVVSPAWTSMMRRGSEARRIDRESMFYPIYADPNSQKIVEVGTAIPRGESDAPPRDGLVAILPSRRNGSEGRWQIGRDELVARMKQGRVRLGRRTAYGFVVNYLPDGAYAEVMSEKFKIEGYADDGSLIAVGVGGDSSRIAPTQWKIAAHNASENGSGLLSLFVPERKFPYPKSLYAVEDALRFFVKEKPEAVVLDFFSGSGTTAHAVMRLNKQDGGKRQCISVTNNEVAADEQKALSEQGLRPGDTEWEQFGICDYITKPRVQAAITGKTPEGKPIKGDYKFTDEFPMAYGFEENAEFFTLTYETPLAVSYQTAFARIAPLLWLRAGSVGSRIDKLPSKGWDVADAYGFLVELDRATVFLKAVRKTKSLKIAYIVTDDERRFQALARRLPEGVEAIRLYESYLTNFAFANGDDA
jgi:adenine-specific DNA-methyltransferase